MQTSQLQYNVIHFQDFNNSHIPEILEEIYLQKIYYPYLGGRKDAVIFDIGLNIGLFSLFASRYASTVYAFEPATDLFKIAKQNIEENKATNVKLFQKAIATTDGKTTFYHCSNKTMYSLNPKVNDNKEKEEVETIRLDTFVNSEKIEHIDFIKLDIEGTEAEVFTSESFKNIVPIVDCMVYEWHSWSISNPNVINSGLMGYGFRKIIKIGGPAVVFACTK
jgi:FkbM family methyltransferase